MIYTSVSLRRRQDPSEAIRNVKKGKLIEWDKEKERTQEKDRKESRIAK